MENPNFSQKNRASPETHLSNFLLITKAANRVISLTFRKQNTISLSGKGLNNNDIF